MAHKLEAARGELKEMAQRESVLQRQRDGLIRDTERLQASIPAQIDELQRAKAELEKEMAEQHTTVEQLRRELDEATQGCHIYDTITVTR
jgi:predicted RNase H-like nuclease (RuvC/YqgF family)